VGTGFGEGRPPEALGDYTGFLLNWIAARSRESFAAALQELSLTPPQFGLMNVIDSKPGASQQELVATTHIDRSTMVATLDLLEEAGLAERRAHASDRRKRVIHLTDAGERTLERARATARRIGSENFGALSEDEFAEFHRLARKVAGLDQ
jgi:DNA-binding MarR family transcriptional regulator